MNDDAIDRLAKAEAEIERLTGELIATRYIALAAVTIAGTNPDAVRAISALEGTFVKLGRPPEFAGDSLRQEGFKRAIESFLEFHLAMHSPTPKN